MEGSWTPQQGISCPGCPHRAAYLVCKKALGRGAGRVICGDAGCPEVGAMHPAATTCPGGEAALLDRYKVAVPVAAADAAEPACEACIHLAPDAELMAADAERAFPGLSREGRVTVLAVLASGRDCLTRPAIESLANRALALGCEDAAIVDPFDTAGASEALTDMLGRPGLHAVVFASPCAQLQRGEYEAEPAEIDAYACSSCHRCAQVTGCPAIMATPPTFRIDAALCSGCDLCAEQCRTHVIYSPRARMTPAERSRARYAAASQGAQNL